ncbi:dUTP diphosphatase [Bacillus sp. NPDC077411]|uniref:dUTP diphosphatase n=1 Tax=Bacillus sp. NPDC077411 TaxID=3363947 RepID=UPI0037CBA9AC
MTTLQVITKDHLYLKFDLGHLFTMQEALDKRIAYKKTDKLDMLFRSLIIEINEAWNETRSFKFWSTKYNIPNKGALLEELVDGLHFLMNIVIELNKHTNRRELVEKFKKQNMTRKNTSNVNLLFEWYIDDAIRAKSAWCTYGDMSRTVFHLQRMFGNLFRICYLYGFTFDDIVKAYEKKNEENFIRQDTGY